MRSDLDAHLSNRECVMSIMTKQASRVDELSMQMYQMKKEHIKDTNTLSSEIEHLKKGIGSDISSNSSHQTLPATKADVPTEEDDVFLRESHQRASTKKNPAESYRLGDSDVLSYITADGPVDEMPTTLDPSIKVVDTTFEGGYNNTLGTAIEYLNKKNKWIAARVVQQCEDNKSNFIVENVYKLQLVVSKDQMKLVPKKSRVLAGGSERVVVEQILTDCSKMTVDTFHGLNVVYE
eukprot:gene37331-46062_t